MKKVRTTPQINYCGSYTYCNNLPGSQGRFECSEDDCMPGFTNWRPYDGGAKQLAVMSHNATGCSEILGSPTVGGSQPQR